MNSCCQLVFSGAGNAGNRMPTRAAADRVSAPSSRVRRSLAVTRWSLPAVVLVLLPKCPACLAAYIALGTGVSLSLASSSYLRVSLLGVCIAAIILNVLWLMRKIRSKRYAAYER
jgi:hypothetical protein